MIRTHNSFTLCILLTASTLSAGHETFHLKNNSNEPIQIELLQGGKSVLPGKIRTVAKRGSYGSNDFDIKKPATLHLYVCDKQQCRTEEPAQLVVEFKNSKTDAPLTGKTLHLKWSGTMLNAQKGNPLTKTFRTDNVEDEDIYRITRHQGKIVKK